MEKEAEFTQAVGEMIFGLLQSHALHWAGPYDVQNVVEVTQKRYG